mmetsp:Transcript_6327/g.14286  ORF Transcript_6327/g.14286 Transcript_6327/m.14286 type:complete len:236 (+) Transcript_6327:771-1478(+)
MLEGCRNDRGTMVMLLTVCLGQRPSGTVLFLVLATLLFGRVLGGSVDFRWKAWIDTKTGIAESWEKSSFRPAPVNLSRPKEREVCQRVFTEYPDWLAKPRVTFGLLRTKPIKDSTCVSLFGRWNVLRFGKYRLSTITRRGREVKTTILLPMVGGFMTLPHKDGCGVLEFSLVQRNDETRMETKIAKGYRPALAGRAPVHPLRAFTYRRTQSLLHAYIMWRFHKHCYSHLVKRNKV